MRACVKFKQKDANLNEGKDGYGSYEPEVDVLKDAICSFLGFVF